MNRNNYLSVSFEPKEEKFVPFLSMDGFFSDAQDPENLLFKAADIYQHSIARMRRNLLQIQELKAHKRNIPARKIWSLGNQIFNLVNMLENNNLELDGLYHHLERDLRVKRKWLEKVIIFRRYLPRQTAIPGALNWGKCVSGTRRCAEKLAKGENID